MEFNLRAVGNQLFPKLPDEKFLCFGRTVRADPAGVQFIGIYLFRVNLQNMTRHVINQVMFTGHRLAELDEVLQLLLIARTSRLDTQITHPGRIIVRIGPARLLKQQFHMLQIPGIKR